MSNVRLHIHLRRMRTFIRQRPPKLKSGEVAFLIDRTLVDRRDEKALTIQFISQRKLFGWCYQALHPHVFDWMTAESGVFIAPLVPSASIVSEMTFPGDIDLLIIPYHKSDLLLSRTLAVELKIVRASFLKQGKSPNEFGFSQANALLDHGFPFVATGHIIISDESPKDAWRTILEATVVNAQTGQVSEPRQRKADMLPASLIDRSFGRMIANCDNDLIGLFAAYPDDRGVWIPRGRKALKNKSVKQLTLAGISEYFETNYNVFVDTPAL